MPRSINKPSADQAQEFNRWMRYWQVELNLQDWRIEAGKKPASKGAMADVNCDPAARLAIYRLGDWGSDEINTETLRATALHECLHIFLFDVITTAQDRASTSEQMEVAEHRVINVLERVLSGASNDRPESK
jgi:hypothetical protein